MMRNDIDQNLRCRADSLPLLFCFIDQRFGFSIQFFRLFDDRSCSIEKVDQPLGCWQGFLDLLKLCVAKAGYMADELNEPVLQHFLTSPTHKTNSLGCSATQSMLAETIKLVDGEFVGSRLGGVRERSCPC